MALRIILSGPLAQRGVAVRTLEAAQIEVDREDDANKDGAHIDAHGLPNPNHGYITCHSDDVDRVASLVGTLGWSLRSHRYEAVGVQGIGTRPPDAAALTARLDAMQAQLDELKAGR